MATTDPTPIPAEPYPGAAEVRKLALNTFWPMVEQRANELGWAASEVVDERMLTAVNNAMYAVGGAAHAAGLAAGRTAAEHARDLTPEGAEVIRAAQEWRRMRANRSVTASSAQVRASQALTDAVDAYNWRVAEHGADQ